MSTFMANKANIERKWYILDAAGKPLGKTAVRAADLPERPCRIVRRNRRRHTPKRRGSGKVSGKPRGRAPYGSVLRPSYRPFCCRNRCRITSATGTPLSLLSSHERMSR